MRPKIVLAILLAGILAIGAIVFLKPHSPAPVTAAAPAPAASAVPTPVPVPAPTPAPVVVKKAPTPEERQAAIDAAKQFESTNAIPALKAAAANAEDNEEAIAMLEAADWLALPSVDFSHPGTKSQLTPEQAQRIEQNRAKAQARWEARMQMRAGNQGSQSGTQSSSDQNSTAGQNQ